MEPLFSNGLYLANLTMSSSILTDSWNAISEHQGNKPVKIIKDHPDYDIIAFVSSPVTASCLQKERLLDPITEISDTPFPLRSDTLPTFSINGDALSLFRSLHVEFAELHGEVEKNEKKGNIIITGRCLNGSVASFYTLLLLNTIDPTKFKLLCITFGSPLLGYDPSQQAVSPHPTWNSYFLHVVHKDDCVPRLFPVPPYKAFGTFLLCSELGGAYFQAPESVIELLKYKDPEAVADSQESQTIYYEKVIEYLKKMHFRRNVSSFLGYEADSYKAGITVFRFGNGLANLALSSNILTDSWNATSKHEGNEPVTIINDHPDYNIIAFVSSTVTTSNLQQQSRLVPASEISDFQFLCSDTHPSFSINEAALSLFKSLHIKLSRLQEEVKTSSEPEAYSASSSSAKKNKKEKPIPYIITGRGLNGSVASLFTLLLLKTLDPTKFKLRCITFGSPLLGDTDFQQAVLRHPTWNSCFLHVVHEGDCVPRLSLVPPYKPFGTFLWCSELGDLYFQAPESVIESPKYKNPEDVDENREARTFNYKNVVECLEKKLLERDYEAGITGQVTEVGLRQRQQQNQDISALIKNIVAHEKIVLKQQREEFDFTKELNEMKVYLALMEWYMEKCRADGHGSGYYDSFKNARERRDNGVDKYKTYLTDYWEKVVDDARKKPPTRGAPLRPRLLYGGTTYRRIVEPLDIAEYYRRGRKDYENRGRSDHYKLLEKWLKDHQEKNPPASAGRQLKVENVTEDSCFWARVEEAIRSCRRLDRDRAGEGAKLIQFQKYIRDLIYKGEVSPDIFLEKSSYMQWWREYEESLKKVEEGSDSDPLGLVYYMKNCLYKYYVKGFWTDSNENPSDTSHSGPSTSGDPHGS